MRLACWTQDRSESEPRRYRSFHLVVAIHADEVAFRALVNDAHWQAQTHRALVYFSRLIHGIPWLHCWRGRGLIVLLNWRNFMNPPCSIRQLCKAQPCEFLTKSILQALLSLLPIVVNAFPVPSPKRSRHFRCEAARKYGRQMRK